MKYGIDEILKPVVEAILQLESISYTQKCVCNTVVDLGRLRGLQSPICHLKKYKRMDVLL